MLFRFCVVFLLFVLLMSTVSGARKDRKEKRRKKEQASTDLDETLEQLSERVEELEEKLASVSGNNVHFFFHGDDGHHDHMHGEDDQHVHVDVHVGHDPHHHSHEDDHFHHEHVAVCTMSSSGVEGSVVIVQADNDRSANFKIKFDHLGVKETEHKLHVHQFGDLSDNCDKIGGHYDPYHEGVDVGDLGTLLTDENGAVQTTWKNDTHLTLFGEYSIVGRSMMVHGADGSGMACCAIGWSPETHDHGMDHSHDDAHSAHDHAHSAHDHDQSAHSHDHAGHDHDHHHH